MAAISTIESILDNCVRPHLHSHGGDIVIKSWAENKLELYFTGRCHNCLASSKQTAAWIEDTLQEQCSEIKQIVVSQQTNPELIAFARKLLKKNADRD